MKGVLFTSAAHKVLIAMWLGGIVMYPLWLRMIETPKIASAAALYFAAIFGFMEAFNFIKRATEWEARKLILGYLQKIWKTSLGIVGFYITFGVLISFAFGDLLPPIGIALLFVFASLAMAAYSRRTGSRIFLIFPAIILLLFWAIIWFRLFGSSEIQSELLVFGSSTFVQIPAIALAAVAAMMLKKEIERTVLPRTVSVVPAIARFRIDVAGRYRIYGWAHPAARIGPVLIYVIPVFVIFGINLVFTDPASVISMVAALAIYISAGTPFGLLKNPGMWLAKTWQFGLGRSRRALGAEFALNIVKASIVPTIFVFGVAFMHVMYMEGRSMDWPKYENFYDEALLLISVNLLCFTWACATYPRRTTECPEFLPIRIVMCVAACFVFIQGVDFILEVRILLVILLVSSAVMAVYLGGRRIAEIDFLSIKSVKDGYST